MSGASMHRRSVANLGKGSSLYASRSICEPTQLPWESPSGSALDVAPADTHLFKQVRRQSGTGKLVPIYLSAPAREVSS